MPKSMPEYIGHVAMHTNPPQVFRGQSHQVEKIAVWFNKFFGRQLNVLPDEHTIAATSSKRIWGMPPSGIQWGLMPWRELLPRLLRFAHRRGQRRAILITKADLSDLVAEAVEKTLNGTRQWDPLKCGLYEHLAGIIASLLYNETRKTLLRPMVHLDEALVAELKEWSPSPEDDLTYRSEITAFIAFIAARDAELLKFLHASLYEENEPFGLACLLNMPIEEVYYKRKRLKKMLRDQQRQSYRLATQAA